ncbi:MAG: ABC transporter ATP-binding protein [Actinomycetota bacterium]
MTSIATTREPVLACAGLTKTYGDHLAVDDLHLEVRAGEIYGILGANGAGKTTSVECAQGLRRPDRGTIRVLGLDPVADKARLRGRVGSQLQQANLPDRLKVREAVTLFADDRAQADRIMREWELEPIAGTPFAGLSGGQRQRLFLALALLNDPEVVFLDELTQGLDPSARSEVWALIERVRDRGTTVVLVTHFMNEAEALCDRVAVMRTGRLVDLDTPAGLVERHSEGVRVRFAGSPADVDWVAAVPLVRSARHDRREIEAVGPSPMIAHLGAELVARSRVPDEIRVAQPSLEEALLALLDPTIPDAAAAAPTALDPIADNVPTGGPIS